MDTASTRGFAFNLAGSTPAATSDRRAARVLCTTSTRRDARRLPTPLLADVALLQDYGLTNSLGLCARNNR